MTFALKALALAGFAQTILMAVAMARSGRARSALLKSGSVDRARAALDKSVWPDDVKKLDNNLSNQFETPPYFLAAVAIALGLGLADAALALLAWVCVAGRVAHMIVHTGSNNLNKRGAAFGVAGLALLLMWVWLALRILAA